MRKQLFLAMIAVLAFVTTGCKNGNPSSMKGTWEYKHLLNGILTESVFTVSSDDLKGAPATITYVSNGREVLNANVLVNYDPDEGEGSIAPADGKVGARGTFQMEGKDELRMTLYKVDGDDYTALLGNADFKLK